MAPKMAFARWTAVWVRVTTWVEVDVEIFSSLT